MRRGSDFAGECVVAGEPSAIPGASGIVDVELILAQVKAKLDPVVAPGLGGGDGGLKVVIDLTSQCVAVQAPLLGRSSPAVEIEGRGSRANRALDAENILHVEAETGGSDRAIIAPET